MAFKKVTDLSAETTISLGGVNKKTGKKNPTSIEGYYLGKKEIEDRKKKSGIGYIYFFETDKGNVGLWGKTDIDRKMVSVKTGEMTRITFTGMLPTSNGDMYKFSVEVDSDNTIEVTEQQKNDEPSFDADEEIDASYSSSSSDDEDDYASQEATQQAALAAAERQAKVKALLAKKK